MNIHPSPSAVQTATESPLYTKDFPPVEHAEKDWIAQRRQCVGGIDTDAPLVGLGLSGGGIRSASFNLGVLQALEEKALLSRVDYLSSVSGGGYIASCLSWIRANGVHSDFTAAKVHGQNGTVLDWLRAHGSYLINGNGFSGWSLAACILAGTLLNVFVLLPLFFLLIAVASRNWFSLAWPATLHLPAAGAIPAHDGFMLIAIAGILSLLLYLCGTLVYAIGSRAASGTSAIFRWQHRLGQLLAAGVMGLCVGLLPVYTGIEESVLHYWQSEGVKQFAHHLSYLLPMLGGAASIWRANKSGSNSLAIAGLALLCYSFLTLLYHFAAQTEMMSSTTFWIWAGVSLLLAFSVDINAISMHGYYRGRLADAYLPPVRENGAAPISFRVQDIKADNGAAFHIINTTLNTSSSKEEKLRSRNAENMVLTPLYCGSSTTGYRRTSDYLGGKLSLSTALSVSGAAVDPDMYETKPRPISFLMALLNIRLGIWTRNPNRPAQRWVLPSWYRLMLCEMLGVGLSESNADIHLADGGHFENLGLYELLRRRCRYIIIGDAGADPDDTLADLGKSVQHARADFGIEIDICVDGFYRERQQALSNRAHVIGKIRYADGSSGELLYLKAKMTQGLTADIYGYWRSNPDFPDESTSDQFYDELQFDAYRELGRQLMLQIIGDTTQPRIEDLFVENNYSRSDVHQG